MFSSQLVRKNGLIFRGDWDYAFTCLRLDEPDLARRVGWWLAFR
jgi:hypothetical protein